MQFKRLLKSTLCWMVVLGVSMGWSAKAFAGRYLITVVEARIAKKKSRFRRWDTGFGKMTLPDPFVVLEASGERLTTKVIKNDLNPRWNASRTFTLKGDERVYITVYDKDVTSNDLIGKFELKFSQLEKGLSLTFGKVEFLHIKVTRLDQPDVRVAEPVKPAEPVKRPEPVKPAEPVKRPEPVKPAEPVKQPEPVKPAEPVKRPEPVKPAEPIKPVEPTKPAGRPVAVPPPVRKVEVPEKTTAYEGLPASGDINQKQFCYAVQRHTLFCMNKQYTLYATSADKKNQATAQFLSALMKRIEVGLRTQDPQIEAQCQKAMLGDGFAASRGCLDCLVQLGCPTRSRFRAACAKACAAPAAPPARTEPVPPVRRVEPAPPVRTEPVPPVRRTEPVPPVRTEPAPPVRRVEPAPPVRTEPVPPVRTEPAVRASAPVAMEVKPFCAQATAYQLKCLQAQYTAAKADPKQASMLGFFKVLIERMEKNKADVVGKCVAKYEEEQAKRKAQNKPVLSNEVLGKCMACMNAAACDRQKLMACRSVCDGN